MSYKRALAGLIIAGIILRCIVASTVELGIDEVYYWDCSRHLQWNYFDHPPMVALMVRIFTLNLSLQQFELFVRLGSIACCAVSTFLIFKTVTTLHSERAGFVAAVLYNASFYGGIISGLFVMPDSPQMVFWLVSLFILSKILKEGERSLSLWILFGLATGLTFMSKIHGVFLWSGVILFILFYKRQWLRNYRVYVAAIVCGLITLPFWIWNFKNNFITYSYHSSRVEGSFLKLHSDSFLREILGEIFYNNPINFVITLSAVVFFLRRKKDSGNEFFLLSIFIAAPMIVLIIALSLFNDTLPHWSGPAYVTLIPLAALYLASGKSTMRMTPISVRLAILLMVLVVVLGDLAINFYPGTLGKTEAPAKFGMGDITLDMYGWKRAAISVDSMVNDNERRGIMSRQSEFVCNKMFPAAHIDYYLARPVGKFVVGLGRVIDLHTFAWSNYVRMKGRALSDAWCIVPSNFNYNVRLVYRNSFTNIDSAFSFPVYRNGKVCRYFTVYRLRGFVGEIPEEK